MRKSIIVLVGLVFLALPVFTASSAAAECEGMREFTGKIQKLTLREQFKDYKLPTADAAE